MSAGVALPDLVRACCRDGAADDPDEQYVQRMAVDFELSRRQQQALHIVMERYKDEELQVYRHANSDLPASLQAELMAASRRRSDRIRAVLTQEQQQRYDERVRATGSVR